MASYIFSWTPQVRLTKEDELLKMLVDEHGQKSWSKISKIVNESFQNSDRTGKQCRERWHNHLDPELNKNPFDLIDEVKVFELQKELGNKWCEIAKHFDGKNDNFIKNCFYSAIRRNLRKYNRDKIPSKQLKGTINSLLKNEKKRKILMNFPEHTEFKMNQFNADKLRSISSEETLDLDNDIPDFIVRPSVTYSYIKPCNDIFSLALSSMRAGYPLYDDAQFTKAFFMNSNCLEFSRRDSARSDLSTISSCFFNEKDN